MTVSDLMRWDEKISDYIVWFLCRRIFRRGEFFNFKRLITGNVLMKLQIFFAIMMRIDVAHIFAEHCNIGHRDGFPGKKYFLKIGHFLQLLMGHSFWTGTMTPKIFCTHIILMTSFHLVSILYWQFFTWEALFAKNCNFSRQKNIFLILIVPYLLYGKSDGLENYINRKITFFSYFIKHKIIPYDFPHGFHRA